MAASEARPSATLPSVAIESADVGVVVPVYNRATTVLEALDSVAAQVVPPRRLIVVDDGSTDGTAGSVRRWMEATATAFPKKLICQENRGASAARNRGSEACEDCTFLAFLDSDDLWPCDFLGRTVAALTACPSAVAATCNQRYVCHDDCNNETFRTLKFLDTKGLAANATEWLFLANRGITPATVLRADVFRFVGRYDEEMPSGEDWKLYLHVSMRGRWLHVPGDPVTVRFGRCATRSEEGHLQLQGENRYLTWVRMIDKFVEQEGGKRAMRRSVYSHRLASRWYSLGRSLMTSGRIPVARECFRRSIYWKRSYHKAWLRLGRTYLPRKASGAAGREGRKAG